jgi:glycosyltransferase involved in cell wall biosynthesis
VRVAFPTPATFDQVHGGGERYVLNIARGLVRASSGETTVEVIAPAPERFRRQLEPGVSLRGVPVHPPDATYGDGVSWELVEAVAEADVIHVHQAFTHFGEAAALAARVFGRTLCITDHGGMTSLVGRRLGLIELADAAVAYSRFGAAALGESPKVTIVEGGVDCAFFRPADHQPPRDHIVFAGRIMAHKGVDVLIRACPKNARITVAGTLADTGYFHLLQELAVGRNVTFTLDATDEELRDLYRRALAVVLPSLHVDIYGRVHLHPELMGLTPLEGMACGAPAVVMRTGGLPEYVDEGVTGFVVDTEAELADRLSRLASDPSLVDRMGQAARRRVCTAWDIEVAGSTLLSLYRRLNAA